MSHSNLLEQVEDPHLLFYSWHFDTRCGFFPPYRPILWHQLGVPAIQLALDATYQN